MKKMALSTAAVLAALLLSGCDYLPAELMAASAEILCSLPAVCSDKDRVILDLQEVNNTHHELAETVIQRPESSNIKNAGTMMRWNKKQKAPVYIKVWWAAVYDRNTYYHGGYTYSRKKEKGPAPGSVWCEAVIKIREPYPANPRHLNVYFYPDGSVDAEVAEHPGEAMTKEAISQLPRAPTEKYCEKIMANPWYGIDSSNPWA